MSGEIADGGEWKGWRQVGRSHLFLSLCVCLCVSVARYALSGRMSGERADGGEWKGWRQVW